MLSRTGNVFRTGNAFRLGYLVTEKKNYGRVSGVGAGDEDLQHRLGTVVYRRPHLYEKPYEERLKELKLPSMEYRRKRGDMIQCYKIMNGLVR